MNTEIIGVVFMYLATIALAIPLGRYIAKVFKGEKTSQFDGPTRKVHF
jgi:K+-transporting ATPase ATPase A chain